MEPLSDCSAPFRHIDRLCHDTSSTNPSNQCVHPTPGKALHLRAKNSAQRVDDVGCECTACLVVRRHQCDMPVVHGREVIEICSHQRAAARASTVSNPEGGTRRDRSIMAVGVASRGIRIEGAPPHQLVSGRIHDGHGEATLVRLHTEAYLLLMQLHGMRCCPGDDTKAAWRRGRRHGRWRRGVQRQGRRRQARRRRRAGWVGRSHGHWRRGHAGDSQRVHIEG